ncbi:hypothetical protein [Streptomyces celluloflavus]|uniref:hypothetical protein n=1 Tax=Streptomyces celluloflavus TaxID=58344 RepID=UPI003460670A|nr:hypothetical protein OG717_19780 [Streptomyces celluloflavus]
MSDRHHTHANAPGHDHDHHPDVPDCVGRLRAALEANGITLPSLGVDLPSFAGGWSTPLVALGNCNAETAQRLTEALVRAAIR